MKKLRILVITLVVAFSMIGAGYAAWSTKIIYNNTMKTAEWNVFIENSGCCRLLAGDIVEHFNSDFEVTDLEGEIGFYDKEDSSDLSGARLDEGDTFVYTMEPNISNTIEKNDTVNFKFFNMHPGTMALTRFIISNGGTIPAKISEIKVSINNGDKLNSDQQAIVDAMVVNGDFWDHLGKGKMKFLGELEQDTKLTNLESELNRILKNHLLSEQHKISEGVKGGKLGEQDNGLLFSIPKEALKVNGLNIGRLSEISVRIEFTFVQYNQN